jgi:SRSO17 transposase
LTRPENRFKITNVINIVNILPTGLPTVFDASANLEQRLAAYAQLFAGCFRRRDQAQWLLHYLQALLASAGRKNVEKLAREISHLARRTATDPVQALQNFINQSPWDERLLWKRLREVLGPAPNWSEGVLAINELGFLKQGQHSIGVHRQYWARLGKKANCQLAVVVGHVGPGGVCPLMLRLYLPQTWARDERRLALAGVPGQYRSFRRRHAIALELLEELLADKVAVRTVVAGAGYGAAPEFRREMAVQGMSFLAAVPGDFPVHAATPAAPAAIRQIAVGALAQSYFGAGKSQASSRVWTQVRPQVPWTAKEQEEGSLGLYIERRPANDTVYAVGNLPAELPTEAVANLWDNLRKLEGVEDRLCEDLGLTHFEGRSWRGFHHHACLVVLAYGFLLREGLLDAPRLSVKDAEQRRTAHGSQTCGMPP